MTPLAGDDDSDASTTIPPDADSDSDSDRTTGADDTTGAPLPACDPSFATDLDPGEVVFEAQPAGLVYVAAIDGGGVAYSSIAIDGGMGEWHPGVHALSPEGQVAWQAPLSAEPGTTVEITDLARAPSGILIAVALQFVVVGGGPPSELALVAAAYSDAGELLWRQEFESSEDAPLDFSTAPRVAISETGRIVIATGEENTSGYPDPRFFELDAAGSLVTTWGHHDPDQRGLDLADLAFAPDGSLYMFATGWPTDGLDAEWLGRWGADGAFAGATTYTHKGADAVAVVPTADGFALLGAFDKNSFDPPAPRGLLRFYDTSGVEVWSHPIDVEGDEPTSVHALAGDCDGRWLVLIGTIVGDVLVVVDDNGMEIERRTVREVPGSLWRLATDPYGNPVLSGYLQSDEGGSIPVIRKLAR